MQPRFPLYRAHLIPIAMGFVLILGLGGTLSACGPAGPTITMTATATPTSLGTLEAATPTPFPTAPPVKDEILPTAIGTGLDAYPGPSTEALPSATPSLTETETLPPPSATLTPDYIQSLRSGKYDDVDPNITYDPYWTALKNPSTVSSYRGTIHASNRVGSEASFRFTGKRFSLGYKRGKSFGTVTVLVDDQTYSFQEEAFDLVWHSPTLPSGDHFVRIIHDSGEAVNLDYIVIVE